jgi:hypothetical protein
MFAPAGALQDDSEEVSFVHDCVRKKAWRISQRALLKMAKTRFPRLSLYRLRRIMAESMIRVQRRVVPLLKPVHIQKRLAWCEEQRDTFGDGQIVWIDVDEKYFHALKLGGYLMCQMLIWTMTAPLAG